MTEEDKRRDLRHFAVKPISPGTVAKDDGAATLHSAIHEGCGSSTSAASQQAGVAAEGVAHQSVIDGNYMGAAGDTKAMASLHDPLGE